MVRLVGPEDATAPDEPVETVTTDVIARHAGSLVVCAGCSRYVRLATLVDVGRPDEARVCDACVTAAVRCYLASPRPCPF